jgi:hypothetical protein
MEIKSANIEPEEKALNELVDVTPPHEQLHLVASIWISSSFADQFSWSIFADKDRSVFIARYVYWDQLFDRERFGPYAGSKYG